MHPHAALMHFLVCKHGSICPITHYSSANASHRSDAQARPLLRVTGEITDREISGGETVT